MEKKVWSEHFCCRSYFDHYQTRLIRERPLMTSDNFRWFLTYLPTMSDDFYLITSGFLGSFWTYLCTLKSDVINERSRTGNFSPFHNVFDYIFTDCPTKGGRGSSQSHSQCSLSYRHLYAWWTWSRGTLSMVNFPFFFLSILFKRQLVKIDLEIEFFFSWVRQSYISQVL